jgi:hypothetical protein
MSMPELTGWETLFLVRLLLLADPKKDDYVYESSTFHCNLPVPKSKN